MQLIKIYVNGIEIDYAEETLTIKEVNTLIGDEIKFTHNSFPFLILENNKTERALGPNHLLARGKQFFDVVVITVNGRYKGELQVLECFKNYRKCNLQYHSQVFNLAKTKIKELFPVISVLGENPPRAYEKTMSGLLPLENESGWSNYVNSFNLKTFPQAMWQFPMIYFQDKFGEINEGDVWEEYGGFINNRNIAEGTSLDYNGIKDEDEGIKVENKNIITLFPYLLSPLLLGMSSVGLRLENSLINDPFFSKILMYSSENNLVEISEIADPTLIPFFENDPYPYDYVFFYWWRRESITLPQGVYTLDYEVEVAQNDRATFKIFNEQKSEVLFVKKEGDINGKFSGSAEFTITAKNVAENKNKINLVFYSKQKDVVNTGKVTYREKMQKKGYMFHPTIDVARYVPDWTFGEYLDQLRKLFNIQFFEDQNEGLLKVKYNDKEVVEKTGVILGSQEVLSYKKNDKTNVKYKYDNDIDSTLVINSANQISLNTDVDENKTLLLANKFKKLTFKNGQLFLTDEDDKKSGIGLFFYEPNEFFSTSEMSTGVSFDFQDIHKRFFKDTTQVYLQPNRLDIEKYVTKYDLMRILETNRVRINHLPYYVDQIDYSSKGSLIKVKMDLIPL